MNAVAVSLSPASSVTTKHVCVCCVRERRRSCNVMRAIRVTLGVDEVAEDIVHSDRLPNAPLAATSTTSGLRVSVPTIVVHGLPSGKCEGRMVYLLFAFSLLLPFPSPVPRDKYAFAFACTNGALTSGSVRRSASHVSARSRQIPMLRLQ